ncbi:MAG: hypothetical protein CMM01_07495 [Rhodopirellula sp.]|nr:hypothetical protein [Rhodopirellula sp.]OUX51716.1 MAG: hypothetical protein CBE43_02700 [Rhodopirellula sp. TMED283]
MHRQPACHKLRSVTEKIRKHVNQSLESRSSCRKNRFDCEKADKIHGKFRKRSAVTQADSLPKSKVPSSHCPHTLRNSTATLFRQGDDLVAAGEQQQAK